MDQGITRRLAILSATGALASPGILRAQPAGRRLRLAHITSAETTEGQFASAFAREVAARTGGRWNVDIFPNAALGGQLEMIQGVSAATIDLGMIATISLGGQIPELEIFNTPFLFRDLGHARAVFDGPVGDSYREAWASKELGLLGWGEFGLRNMTANRPVPNAAAMAGLKLRVPPSPVAESVFRAMGADPAVLPWGQVPDALRSGTMHAQENPLTLIISARLNEVQSHLMLTRHTYTAVALLASPELMEDLRAEDRAHFLVAAAAGKAASRAAAERVDQEGAALLRSRGMQVVEAPDMGSFRAARNAANDALNQLFGAAALQRIAAA